MAILFQCWSRADHKVCEIRCVNVLSDSRHYIQGVSWDPCGLMLATLSSDRSVACKFIVRVRVILQ